jgi:hypothetical protein
MSEHSCSSRTPRARNTSLVVLIVVAAFVSAFAVTTGGTVAAPTIALAHSATGK